MLGYYGLGADPGGLLTSLLVPCMLETIDGGVCFGYSVGFFIG